MRYSILPIRVGLGLVFLMFGFDKICNPAGSLAEIMNIFASWDFESARAFAFTLGIVEIAIGLGIFFGFFTRALALVATIFFILILLGQWGSSALDYRDIGLLGMSISLLISGAGDKSLDRLLLKKYSSHSL